MIEVDSEVTWKLDDIRETVSKSVKENFSSLSKEELLDYIIDMRTASYGINYVLSRNDWSENNPYSGTDCDGRWFTSDLFVDTDENEDCMELVLIDGKHEYRKIEPNYSQPLPSTICHSESVSLRGVGKIHDSIQLLSAHASSIGCYISQGSITFGDIRYFDKVLNYTPKKG